MRSCLPLRDKSWGRNQVYSNQGFSRISVEGWWHLWTCEAHAIVQFLDVSLLFTFVECSEPLNRVLGPPPKPFIEEALKLELKGLRTHLRYVFFGETKLYQLFCLQYYMMNMWKFYYWFWKGGKQLWDDKCQISMVLAQLCVCTRYTRRMGKGLVHNISGK